MSTDNYKRTGRPPRASIEVVRTIMWYWWVLNTSGWSEYGLEVTFDEKDRRALGLHKGSRWNKYKFGRASPSAKLLYEVDQRFPGALACYNHPIWTLASEDRIEPRRLRQLLESMPGEIVDGLVDRDAPADSLFWVRVDAPPRELIRSMLSLNGNPALGYFAVLAGLLALIHDSINRQNEVHHFECHVALAYATINMRRKVFSETYLCNLESHVLGRWLGTEYRSKQLREVVEIMRGLQSGPQPPWAPRQSSLSFGGTSARKEANENRDKQGFWVAQNLVETAKKFALVA